MRELTIDWMVMFDAFLSRHMACFQSLVEIKEEILKAGNTLVQAIAANGKILICGNGGSAADAQHFAAEIVVRLVRDRQALPAIALTTDTSILTAAANDFGFDQVFSRQVAALGRSGDVLVALSTSGNSPNIRLAAKTAAGLGMEVVSLTGSQGGALKALSSQWVGVCGTETARIQEAHMFILHLWAAMIEAAGTGEAA
jgi:D-sedoheptulose 7-phosphate isomerase